MEENYVFFIHTPYQARIVRLLVGQLDCKKAVFFCEGEVVCSLVKSYFRDISYGFKIVLLEKVAPADIGVSGYKKMTANVDLVLLNVDCWEGVEVFISDVNWPINNYIFFCCGGSARFNIFEEGIGNYLAVRRGGRELLRGMARFLLGIVKLGPQFRPYLGEQMGGDQKRALRQYLLNPSLSDSKGNLVGIYYRDSGGYSKIENGSFIFLDQPYANLLGREKYRLLLLRIFELYSGRGYSCYIKKHHFSDSDSVYAEIGFKLLKGPAIEDYEIPKGVVFGSFTSSALFNLKLLHGENVTCFYFMLNEAMRAAGSTEAAVKRIREKFESVGVRPCRELN